MVSNDEFPREIMAFTVKMDKKVPRPYRLVRELGRGGMGVVCEAVDLAPPSWYRERYGHQPRRVVIKYLKDPTENERNAARFLREASLAHVVDHPNVAHVHGLCVDEEGGLFLVMDYEENARTLADVLHVAKKCVQKNPVTMKNRASVLHLSLFCIIMHQLLDAIEAVHAKLIIHRDLKPENVLLVGSTNEPGVRLFDFGIAKSLDEKANIANVTQENVIPGTPLYMSPEQIRSGLYQTVGTETVLWGVSPRSDIWALGVMMYELITGECPFFKEKRVMNEYGVFGSELDYVNICSMISDDAIQAPPMSDYVDDLPKSLVTLVNGCLTKPPWERLASADAVRQLLREVEVEIGSMKRRAEVETRPVPVLPPVAPVSPVQIPQASSSRRVRLQRLVVAAALCVAFVFLGWNACSSTRSAQLAASTAEIISVVDTTKYVETTSQSVAPAASTAAAVVVARRTPSPAKAEPGAMTLELAQAEASLKSGQYFAAELKAYRLLAKYPAFPPPFRILAECALLHKPQHIDAARLNAEKYLHFEGTSSDDFSAALKHVLPESSK